MNVPSALLAGFVAGLAIAMQFGAVGALLLNTAITAGPRVGVAAGLGVASVDLAFAAVAVVAGSAVRAGLAGHERELKIAAAVALGSIALHGLRRVAQAQPPDLAFAAVDRRNHQHSAAAHYLRFLGLTAVNPLTVLYFTSVAASLSVSGLPERLAFVAGTGGASAAWHVPLTLAAGHAGRWFTPPIRRGVTIAGHLVVLGMALQFALALNCASHC